jgi:hypothetical protein
MADVPTTRERDIVLKRDLFRYKESYDSGSSVVGPFTGVSSVVGRQITVSEGHPWTRQSRFKGEDIGGEFYTKRNGFDDERGLDEVAQPQYSFRYKLPPTFWTDGPDHKYDFEYFGPVYPVCPYNHESGLAFYFPPDLSRSDEEMDALGTTAISRCKPTTSPANLSVSLAELIREGLPSMIGHQTWKDRTSKLRDKGASLGHEHLNVQFGILPLVSDVKTTASAISRWEELLTQYERDSGRLVRRKFEFPIDRTVETTEIGSPGTQEAYFAQRVAPSWVVDPTSTTSKLVREREIVRKTWFSGGFTYYLPSDFHSRNEWRRVASQARYVLGLELTPEVLWNLAPWSWAADWFSNTGDVLSNISDFASDGLVLRYGYLMDHTIIKDTYTLSGVHLKGYGRRPITSTFSTEIKKRRHATPFGFGLEGGLTARQLSIIAALGLTKFKR